MNNSKEKLNDELLESVSGGYEDDVDKQLKAALEAAEQASHPISFAYPNPARINESGSFTPSGSTPPDSQTIEPSLPF